MAANQIIERRNAMYLTDFFADAVGPQQIAHPSVRSDDTQRSAACGKFRVKLMQHVRAGEIDIGRCREIADHHLDV